MQLTSQHPYAEVYIGPPHVWTVDIEDPVEVERAVRSILSQKVNKDFETSASRKTNAMKRMRDVLS